MVRDRHHARAGEIAGMFEGPVLPVTARLAAPILIGSLFQLLYTFVDTLFIARIDPQSTALLSGTGLVFPLFFLFLALGTGIGVGVSSLVARAIGERNAAALDRAAVSGLALSVSLAALALAAGLLFGDRIVNALAGDGLSAAAVASGRDYFLSLLPGLCLMLVGQSLIGVLQGEGRNRYIAMAMVTATVVNIGLDPLFIFALGLGVRGAGLATSVAVAASGMVVIPLFLTGRTTVPLRVDLWHARLPLVGEIVRIGVPQSLSMLGLAIAFMLLNKLVSSIGETAMNAWTLVGRMDQLLLVPGHALGGATITMIGQNYGRQLRARTQRVLQVNLVSGVLVALALATLYNLAARPLMTLFTEVAAVVDAAVRQIRIVSFSFAGVIAAFIAASTFQGTGRPLPALVTTIVRLGVVSVPLAYLLAGAADLGIRGVYYGVLAGNLLSLPLAWLWSSAHLRRTPFAASASQPGVPTAVGAD